LALSQFSVLETIFEPSELRSGKGNGEKRKWRLINLHMQQITTERVDIMKPRTCHQILLELQLKEITDQNRKQRFFEIRRFQQTKQYTIEMALWDLWYLTTTYLYGYF